jgi:hypothetical protein
MSPIQFKQTTGATPEQFTAGLTRWDVLLKAEPGAAASPSRRMSRRWTCVRSHDRLAATDLAPLLGD